MNKLDAAKIISGLTDFETEQSPAPTNVHIITGEVGSTSEDGKVMVSLDGLVFSDDNDQFVEFDTLGGLEEGDTATILLTGENGRAMVPLAIGGVGTVDRIVERVGELYADYAEIGELVADKASITDLEAATARIGDLEADHVSVSDFQAEQANIDTLQANTADIATIRANSAKVQNLTAAQLEADHATIGTLDTTYMHANMSNSDVAWIENGTIKNGAIVSAMINDVSANKLTAGTINGSIINVTNLNADNITTGTINGQRIGEGSLSLSKLEDDVYTEAEVNNIVDGLNDRIDGAIETHTGTAVPTLNNSPASSWNTTKLKDEHVGDVYYVVNSQSQQNGYCYRFTKSGSTYSWQLIKDSDVTAALSRLTTAEGKITTFDSDISTLKTDTGTLTTRTTNLETRMSDAEDDILDKVDTTTFNEVSDTVDAHTQTISQHTTAIANKADSSTVTAVTNRVSKNEQDISGINTTIGQLQTTVESKADGSTVTTISNRLNTVSDTVDGHTQSITSLQNTVSQKADSSTVSTLQSDYATFKQQTEQFESTVGTRLTTIESDIDGVEQRVSDNETSISNNASAIALKADSSTTYSKTDVDGLISTEVTDRNAAITAKANEITSTVSQTYTTKQEFAELEIGGRNLLTGTGDWSGAYPSSGSGSASGDTFTFSAHTSLSWYSVSLSHPHMPFSDVDGQTLTLSFDYRSDDFSDTSGDYRIWINAAASDTESGSRTKYREISTSAFNGVFVPTTEWQRGSITFDLSESLLTAGSGECSYFYIQFYNHTLNSLQLRHVKLERGNKATDWTPAPEDKAESSEVTRLETRIDQTAESIALSAYQSARPNLAPLGTVDFSDKYNAADNPSGYWRATIGAWFTRLDDGWVRVYADNTSGTSATNSTSWRPSPSPSVVAGGVYTILTEIRNNHSSGSSQTDMYLQQIANNQFWGDINGTTIDDEHVTTTTNVSLRTCGETYVRYSYRIADTEHLTTTPIEMFRYNFRLPAGGKFDFEFRQSVYEGIYDGPYKPYSGAQLYASHAELKVTNDSISTKVDKNGVISSINQSAESVTIDADKINLVGAVTIGDLASATQDAVLNSNLQVGGRNLLPKTQDWSGANKQSNGTFTVTADKYAGCSVITQVWTSANCDLGYQGNVWTQPLEADTWYTLSFWAKASSSIRSASYLYSSNVVDDGINSSGQVITATDGYVLNSITTDWQRIWVSWHIKADATEFPQNLIITRLNSTHSGVTLYVAGAKLEKGNKPTDWTPASEDVAQKSDVTWTGTCETAAGTAAKEVVCDGFTASELTMGATICVRFNAANTSSGALTLNVNGTGAKTITVASGNTSSTNQLLWASGATIRFMYNASGQWRVADTTPTYYSTCSIAEGVAAKTAGCAGCVIFKGVAIHIVMTAANTNTSATLNVNGTGAKAIYYGNTTTRPTTANEYGWKAGATASFVFDGAYWRYADASAMYQSADAAKTATNYIVADSSGIKIADANPASSTTYQHQTSSGTDFVVNGGVRNRVDSTGMTLYNGSGTSDANIVAKFTEALIEIGKNSTSAVIKFCGGVASLTYTTVNKFFNITALRAALRGVSEYENTETANAQVAAQFNTSDEGDTTTANLLMTATANTAIANLSATASGASTQSPSASVELGSGNGTSTITMLADYGLKLNNGPNYIKGFNFGFSTGTTNSNGVTTFNPGMGVAPTAVFVAAGKASNETEAVAKIAVPMVWSIDGATQVQVRWQRSDTNAWLASNAVGWYWLAIY